MNKSIVISVVLLVLIGIGVSRIKYEVVFLRKTVKTLATETEKSMDNIKVLEAEWSYLNSPERLKKLANKYLPEMKPIGVGQVMLYNKIIGSDLVATKTEENDSSFKTLLDEAVRGN